MAPGLSSDVPTREGWAQGPQGRAPRSRAHGCQVHSSYHPGGWGGVWLGAQRSASPWRAWDWGGGRLGGTRGHFLLFEVSSMTTLCFCCAVTQVYVFFSKFFIYFFSFSWDRSCGMWRFLGWVSSGNYSCRPTPQP